MAKTCHSRYYEIPYHILHTMPYILMPYNSAETILTGQFNVYLSDKQTESMNSIIAVDFGQPCRSKVME